MSFSTRASHGIKASTDSTKAASQSQAMWRFLNNASVTAKALIEPLQQAAREGASAGRSNFVLVMHDWSKIDFKRHKSKKDLLQVTHEHDIGYELMASVAVDASSGNVLAPVAMMLRTGDGLYSTLDKPPKKSASHLN